MTPEENIKHRLVSRFPMLADRVRIQRPRRVSVDVDAKDFEGVFKYAIDDMDFSILCAITGLDEGANLAFIYHIARTNGTILNIKMPASKQGPAIKTITGYFPCADIYERELMDLFGAKVEGLAEGTRYPLPDQWPVDEFPLRKDWKRKGAKEGEVKKDA